MIGGWWKGFFDDDYLTIWEGMNPPDQTAREIDALWTLLELGPDRRVLDAPCGFGRTARPLADRGARVTGVDLSTHLLARAEADRGPHGEDRLRYLRQDLRRPLPDGGFDAALDVFSSIGYGDEADDRAVLATLHGALRPGGLLFIETMHRDEVVARLARGVTEVARRDADGTLVIEAPRFDAMRGRLDSTFHWSGPRGHGTKASSIRLYTPTELVALAASVGFAPHSAHRGASLEAYRAEGPDMGGRLGLLLRRPA